MGYIEELRKIVGHRPLILTGSVGILVNKRGQLLLQQRVFPAGSWGLPGGLMELGESAEETCMREVWEETGLTAGSLKLINVYSGKNYLVTAENGDQFYAVTIAYFTETFSGEMKMDPQESMNIKFYHPDEFPENMVGSHKVIIEDFICNIYKKEKYETE
ncbi:MAG: NUDIX hydrolase [Bacillota bacterium]